jgi:reductive dehalogenase
MFSRRELSPGTEAHSIYYDRHPERLELDERWRRKPGLMSDESRYAHALAFAAADSTFSVVETLQPLVDGEPAAEKHPISPEEASEFLCSWARNLGALDAGITGLSPYHIYTTGGRRERYDRPVDLDHTFAIAFTVEMDHRMMRSAPASPTLMESARQYLNAGSIAVQLAAAIRTLGYRARAHIDANYQVICPIVARDAGLGEIGRMGLLMTPTHGPRVRIGIVTTDMPLTPSDPAPDPSIEEFCRLCEKCAKVCPSQALPYGDREDQPEPGHWRVDPESCFSYWCDAGTDCGRCVITCPYAHPDTLLHRMVRLAIRRSPLLRRLAVPLDDLAYGVRPASSPIPEWLDVRKRER